MHFAYEHGIQDWRDSPSRDLREPSRDHCLLVLTSESREVTFLCHFGHRSRFFGMNPSPHPYSFTTMESFQATRSKPKLIKLSTSFLQSTRFCPFLCWFQCLSDPVPSQFQCAQLAQKYPGGGKNKRNKEMKKKKVKANNFLLSLQTAQHRNR